MILKVMYRVFIKSLITFSWCFNKISKVLSKRNLIIFVNRFLEEQLNYRIQLKMINGRLILTRRFGIGARRHFSQCKITTLMVVVVSRNATVYIIGNKFNIR